MTPSLRPGRDLYWFSSRSSSRPLAQRTQLDSPPAKAQHPVIIHTPSLSTPVLVPLRNPGIEGTWGWNWNLCICNGFWQNKTLHLLTHVTLLLICFFCGVRGTNTFHLRVLTIIASPAWGGDPLCALLPLLSHQFSLNLQDMGLSRCICSLAPGPWEGKFGQDSPLTPHWFCVSREPKYTDCSKISVIAFNLILWYLNNTLLMT